MWCQFYLTDGNFFIHTLFPVNRWSYRVYLKLWRVKMGIYMHQNPRIARTTNDITGLWRAVVSVGVRSGPGNGYLEIPVIVLDPMFNSVHKSLVFHNSLTFICRVSEISLFVLYYDKTGTIRRNTVLTTPRITTFINFTTPRKPANFLSHVPDVPSI